MASLATLTPRQLGISTIVKVLLAGRGMTQSDLATAMGCHKTTVHQALYGKRRWTIEDLESMSQILDVPVARFFEDPEELFPGLVAESPRTESNRRPSHYE
jgi:transcriptional regulator with XRE-family HTH domain